MQNKEKLLKDIEEFTKDGDLKSYILICDKGSVAHSRGKADLLSDITTFIHWQYIEKKNITEHDVDNICKLSKMNSDELSKEFAKNWNKALKKSIENNEVDKLEKMLKEIKEML